MALIYLGPWLAGRTLESWINPAYNELAGQPRKDQAPSGDMSGLGVLANARPNAHKLILQVKDDITDNIRVQYNPTEISDTRSAEYEMQEVQGRATKEPQYKGGGDRTISFQLWLNAWKDHHPGSHTPEETIAWLRAKQEPKDGAAPPILQLVWREVVSVVIVDVNVTRSVMRGSMEPNTGSSSSAKPTAEEIYKEAFRRYLGKSQPLAPKIFDALRATVDVTLKAYASSNDESSQSFAQRAGAALARGISGQLSG